MKKVLSILLVSLLIFNSAGYVLVFFQLKFSFQKEALSKLEDFLEPSEMTVINISKNEFTKGSENFYRINEHEINFYGKLYDISQVEFINDSVKIVALSDENENKLNDFFELALNKNLNDKFSKTASIIKLLITEAGLPTEFSSASSWREDMCYNFIFVPILKTFLEIPTPPPKSIS
ncbi:MAG: hypothetical protein ACOYN6_00760 [Ignavibacteria bacterium]